MRQFLFNATCAYMIWCISIKAKHIFLLRDRAKPSERPEACTWCSLLCSPMLKASLIRSDTDWVLTLTNPSTLYSKFRCAEWTNPSTSPTQNATSTLPYTLGCFWSHGAFLSVQAICFVYSCTVPYNCGYSNSLYMSVSGWETPISLLPVFKSSLDLLKH